MVDEDGAKRAGCCLFHNLSLFGVLNHSLRLHACWRGCKYRMGYHLSVVITVPGNGLP